MINRRSFVALSGAASVAVATDRLWADDIDQSAMSDINIVGPKEGFSPQVGTLISMMNWMRGTMLRSVRGLSVRELDFQLDDESNSIGSMLWHLAAVERFYQRKTFDGQQWDGLLASENRKWDSAESLGASARGLIKGYDIDFYLGLLEDVRAFSIAEMKKRDDKWLMTVDKNFWNSPTNYYCMWWHVAEHESNHNGQFKMITKRVS